MLCVCDSKTHQTHTFSRVCELGADCSHTASQFFSEYRSWCLAVGKKPKNQTAFKRALEATKGVYQKRTAKGNIWFGIQPCLMV